MRAAFGAPRPTTAASKAPGIGSVGSAAGICKPIAPGAAADGFASVAAALAAAPPGVHAAALAAALGPQDGTQHLLSASRDLSESAAAAAVCYAVGMTPPERPHGVYYHRELLTRSLEGRRVDLLTISGVNGMLESTEEMPPCQEGAPSHCLFPEGGARPRSCGAKREGR